MDKEYIAEWFHFADMDLESAEYLQGKCSLNENKKAKRVSEFIFISI